MIETRAMVPADRSYVMSTWLGSYWPTARAHEYEGRAVADFHRAHQRLVDHALTAGTQVVIAFDKQYPLAIAGWAAFTGTTLHYVYTRGPLRRAGVAKALLSTAPGLWAHSHATSDYRAFCAATGRHTLHRPGHFNPPSEDKGLRLIQ